jgi:5-methyltetrahydropteroyltriglutamate--homocysteine methyltransferase
MDRILVSHAGTLPRPEGLKESLQNQVSGAQQALTEAVAAVVRRQADMGIDIVNDGEFSKVRGFSEYVRERIGGIGDSDGSRRRLTVMERDAIDFPGFIGMKFKNWGSNVAVCNGPLTYIGQEITRSDIGNLAAAIKGVKAQGYLPSIAPGTIEHWLHDEHYRDTEKFLFAIADAMHDEYKAITDAGFLLQIDDPDLPDGWQMFPDMSVKDYRKYASLRVDALNHALRGISPDLVRLHICWGSNHGPHKNDIPFEDIIDIVLRVKAQCVSFEFANVRHEHEWRVWQGRKLRDGVTIMPGVVGHASDIIEHPRVVADRLITFAHIVGRDNVIAGTDCGLATRLPHGELTWAKLEAMVEGARIASKELWASKPAGAKRKAAKKAAKRPAKKVAKKPAKKSARKSKKSVRKRSRARR